MFECVSVCVRACAYSIPLMHSNLDLTCACLATSIYQPLLVVYCVCICVCVHVCVHVCILATFIYQP